MRKIIFFFSISLIYLGNVAIAQNQTKNTMQTEVLTAIRDIVETEFYDIGRIDSFLHAAGNIYSAQKSGFLAMRGNPDFDNQINIALSNLKDNHTMRFTRQESGFYELIDIFAYAVTDKDRERLFPGINRPNYFGIGLIAEKVDGKYFVSKLYDGYPAAVAGLRVGDEILSMSGAASVAYPAFQPVQKFTSVKIRRERGKDPFTLDVPIIQIYPQDMFLTATLSSMRVLETDNERIGYIRLWSGSNGGVFKELKHQLFNGSLKDVDGLILDIRSRWGGANLEDANIFVSNISSMKMDLRDGTVIEHPSAWNKPVVAIIDKGTRSGMEMFAYNLQKNGIPLIGQRTAGALTAATAFLLPDDSLLMTSIGTVAIDGKNLDGIGITPNIELKYQLPYANGQDTFLNEAISQLQKQIS